MQILSTDALSTTIYYAIIHQDGHRAFTDAKTRIRRLRARVPRTVRVIIILRQHHSGWRSRLLIQSECLRTLESNPSHRVTWSIHESREAPIFHKMLRIRFSGEVSLSSSFWIAGLRGPVYGNHSMARVRTFARSLSL